ncbi:MAG: hypothetical protein AAF697_10495 [Pseudomonadota bacterium]
MDEHSFDPQLEELEKGATDRLLCAEVYDHEAFESLYEYLCSKAPTFSQSYVLPKQILKCIRAASGAIRSRAEYLHKVKPHLPMADKFEMLLDQLIAGETCDDRVPGTPRVL